MKNTWHLVSEFLIHNEYYRDLVLVPIMKIDNCRSVPRLTFIIWLVFVLYSYDFTIR